MRPASVSKSLTGSGLPISGRVRVTWDTDPTKYKGYAMNASFNDSRDDVTVQASGPVFPDLLA